MRRSAKRVYILFGIGIILTTIIVLILQALLRR